MIRLSVTAGCPRGIGPEVLARALAAGPLHAEITVLGPRELLAPWVEGIAELPAGLRFVDLEAGPEDPDRFAAEALRALTDRARAGEADAIVTGPIRKSCLDRLGAFPGQTEWCHHALALDDEPPLMSFAGGPFLLGLVSAHLPLREAPAAWTPARVVQKARRLIGAARALTGRDRPRLVVLGLNPHAGEGGRLGDEEGPVREALAALDDEAEVRGPLPADGFFAHGRFDEVDAVLAAYHDQGLAPYKPLCASAGVNLTWGLTTPRTSPDHGTADDIAGQGVADPRSMRAALELAARLARGAATG